MNFTGIISKTQRIIVDNSPVILTGVGVAGALMTAYLAAKASFKAAEIIRDEEECFGPYEDKSPVDTKEKVRLVWKLYVPAAISGTATVSAIIFANRIGTRRATAMAAAFSLSERAFDEYKAKVVEKIGENKERAVRDEIAQDRVTRRPVASTQVIVAGGSVMCFDMYSGRYFLSDMETLKQAQNNLNYRLLNDFFASLSDYYDMIGLPPTTHSDQVGWNSDKLLDVAYSTVLSEDGKPCIALDFTVVPLHGYNKVN